MHSYRAHHLCGVGERIKTAGKQKTLAWTDHDPYLSIASAEYSLEILISQILLQKSRSMSLSIIRFDLGLGNDIDEKLIEFQSQLIAFMVEITGGAYSR